MAIKQWLTSNQEGQLTSFLSIINPLSLRAKEKQVEAGLLTLCHSGRAWSL